jgi:hypothetical protein
MEKHDVDSWQEYRRLVIASLEKLEKDLRRVEEKIDDTGIRIAVLETKLAIRSMTWGTLGAAIPSAIAIGFMLLRS